MTITLPAADEAVTRASFHFHVDKIKLQQAEHRDGHYLLRSNLTAEDPAVLWTRYIQLTNIEAAFRTLKSDLGLRPIYHRREQRVEAHIFVAFLAYCLQVTLRNGLRNQAPGLSPQAVMEKLATIQMIDVWIPTRDNRWLVLPRHTLLRRKCRSFSTGFISLPAQPPPRIKAPVAAAFLPALPAVGLPFHG